MEDINNNILLNSSDRYFKDKISPSTSTSDNDGTYNLKLITLLRRDEASSDPFVTVKHDPAVLEAFVTIDKNEMKEGAGSSSYMDNEKETVLTTNKSDEALKTGFDDIVASVETSLRSLTPEKLKLLMDYARILRLQRELNQRQMECAFCKKNGKLPSWYTGHVLRDQSGRVQCPVLRGIRCPRCSATGDRAHTIKYCPESLF